MKVMKVMKIIKVAKVMQFMKVKKVMEVMNMCHGTWHIIKHNVAESRGPLEAIFSKKDT